MLAAELARPDVELSPEEFSTIWRAYVVEKRRGRVFDPMLVALLIVLNRQVLQLDEGIDDLPPALPHSRDGAQGVRLDGSPVPQTIARRGMSMIAARAERAAQVEARVA